jgi:hypothetical protein
MKILALLHEFIQQASDIYGLESLKETLENETDVQKLTNTVTDLALHLNLLSENEASDFKSQMTPEILESVLLKLRQMSRYAECLSLDLPLDQLDSLFNPKLSSFQQTKITTHEAPMESTDDCMTLAEPECPIGDLYEIHDVCVNLTKSLQDFMNSFDNKSIEKLPTMESSQSDQLLNRNQDLKHVFCHVFFLTFYIVLFGINCMLLFNSQIKCMPPRISYRTNRGEFEKASDMQRCSG